MTFLRQDLAGSDAPPEAAAATIRAKRERLETFYRLLPELQGHNLALTVLHVPDWLQRRSPTLQGYLAHKKLHNPLGLP